MGKILLRNIQLKGVASDILIDGEYISDVLPAGSAAMQDEIGRASCRERVSLCV